VARNPQSHAGLRAVPCFYGACLRCRSTPLKAAWQRRRRSQDDRTERSRAGTRISSLAPPKRRSGVASKRSLRHAAVALRQPIPRRNYSPGILRVATSMRRRPWCRDGGHRARNCWDLRGRQQGGHHLALQSRPWRHQRLESLRSAVARYGLSAKGVDRNRSR